MGGSSSQALWRELGARADWRGLQHGRDLEDPNDTLGETHESTTEEKTIACGDPILSQRALPAYQPYLLSSSPPCPCLHRQSTGKQVSEGRQLVKKLR